MFAMFCLAVLVTGGVLSAGVIRFTRKHGLT